MDYSRSTFQSYSKIIGTDMDRSVMYDFLLVVHTMNRFWDKRRFRLKIAKFSHPQVFNIPAEGFPRGRTNLTIESCPYQRVERVWRCVHSFRYDTRVWRTDRQTDTRTDRALLCMHRFADARWELIEKTEADERTYGDGALVGNIAARVYFEPF